MSQCYSPHGPFENWPDVTRFRTKGHNVFIRENGAIEIREARQDGAVVFAKAGADGKGVWE